MKVFVTGGTGWLGSTVVRDLLGAGHEVTALARSERASNVLTSVGAQPLRGSLEDLDSLRRGAQAADGVVHTAFVHDLSPMDGDRQVVIHDFANFAANSETDRRAIVAFGAALAGSRKPLVVAAGLPFVRTGGRPVTEEDVPDYAASPIPRVSEKTAVELASQGIGAMVVRLPPSVHGEGDHGFVPDLVEIARSRRNSAYIGTGDNRWPAVHRLDAGRLFRLALEQGVRGALYHAVADAGVPFREIAERIGRGLGVPVTRVEASEAAAQFAGLGGFVRADLIASSALTQDRLGWRPAQPGLLADLEQGHYFHR